MQKRAIDFDLEGPLSPTDFAQKCMGLVFCEDVFTAISRWDDLLTMDKENNSPGHIPDYEPGDTLSWIVPHIIYHKISEERLRELSQTAGLINGARELIADLRNEGVIVGINSTSYEQHAKSIAQRLGVDSENVYCTAFSLNRYQEELRGKDLSLIDEVEEKIRRECFPIEGKDEKIREICSKFYLKDLLELGINPRGMVRVNGGTRKVDSVNRFAEKFGIQLSEMVVAGDSITDINMLRVIRDAGGLAVVFNGNRYALTEGNVGLATTNMRDLKPIAVKFWEGGLQKVQEYIIPREDQTFQIAKEGPPVGEISGEGEIHWLPGMTSEERNKVVEAHSKTRGIVRKEAAALG